MSANSPEVQVLADGLQTAILKVTGYYTGAATGNVTILRANNLVWANTSKPANACVLTISKVQYTTDIAAGTVQLYWGGTNSNAAIYNFGTSVSGELNAYVTNNANTPTGDLGLFVNGAGAGDSFNFVITINKEGGYANGYVEYNASDYRPS